MAMLVSANLSMIFFFVFVSAAALTLYRMFQAKDLPLLMSLPARDGSLFLAKLAGALTDVGRSMILPFPVCLAFASVMGEIRSPVAVIIFLIGWAGVMLQLASLSIVAALILGRIITSGRWMAILRTIAITVAALILLVIFMGYVHRADLGTSSIGALGIEEAWRRGDVETRIGDTATRRHGDAETVAASPRRRVATSQRAAPAMGNTRAVILKEARVLWREPHIWIGLAIPLVLFPVFIFLSAQEQVTEATYIVIVSLLTTASYSLSCIGREGRSFFLLRSLPTRMSVVLRAKFSLGCAINLIVTLAFAVALYLFRRSSSGQIWYNVLVATITSVYLSAFGTALAALFPKFNFASPMRAASLPGLLMLYLITSLFGFSFIGTVSAGWRFTPLVLIPWAGIALILMKIGQERLERMDI